MTLLAKRCNIVDVDSVTANVCMSLGATGCNCTCSSCLNCSDCVDCPDLTIADIFMKIYRAGTKLPQQPPVYLFMYQAYTLTGNVVCFFIDVSLTGLVGRYIGDIFVKGNACGSVEMQVGDKCAVFNPYTVSTGGGIGNDLQPVPP